MREEDRKLIRLGGEVKLMSFEEVYKQFEKFIYKTINTWRGVYEKDELKQIAMLGLYKAYLKYDVESGYAFLTYAGFAVTNELNYYHRHQKKHRNVGSLFEIVINDSDGNSLELIDILADDKDYEEEALKNVFLNDLDTMLNVLSLRDKNILKDYYLKGISQKELAKKYGSQQANISRTISKSLKILKEKYVG